VARLFVYRKSQSRKETVTVIASFDLKKFLGTPWFALDQLSVFSDVSSFLDFSEKSIELQKLAELQRVESEKDTIDIEEEHRYSFYEHQRESVLFRFDVALPMRVRYAALSALVATIEWSVTILRPAFEIPKAPKGTSAAVHLLTVFAERCDMPLDDDIRRLAFLIWVRNSIMHNSGVLKGYRHAAEIKRAILGFEPDFTISNWHFIGDTVEIKRGALEPLISSWSEIVRELYTAATEKKLLLFNR
jgi:hypothetical protein